MKNLETPAIGQIWKTESSDRKFKIKSSHINEKGFEMFHCEYIDDKTSTGRWFMGKGWFDGTSGYILIKKTTNQ